MATSGTTASLGLVLPTTPTKAGNTLLAIATITTLSTRLDNITDDAGNLWTRAVDGPNAIGTAVSRFEIWYVLDARPITRATATLPVEKAVSIDLMEWDGLVQSGTLLTNVGATTITTTISTTIDTLVPALVVGAAACGTSTQATLTMPEFTPSTFLTAAPASSCNVAYAPRLAGTQEISWTLPIEAACSAGVVAIPLIDPPI